MMSHRPTIVAALAACFTLTGCTLHLNKPDGLLGTTLPALDPAPVSVIDDAPSVTAGHDRSHWQRTTVTVPLRQVEHHPHYTHAFLLEPTTHRAAGSFPTTDNALDVERQTAHRVLESPLNFAGAGALLIWAPIDMIVNARWPFTVERASASAYQRMVIIDSPDQFRRWIEVDPADSPRSNEGDRP